jgi:general secretion pathway protein I
MRNQQGGFTLLEVMIAMAILSIALLAVFQMQSQSISMATEARFTTTASLLAQSKMADVESAASLTNRTENGDFGRDYPQYGWNLKVTDTRISGFKRVEVTIFNKVLARGGSYSLLFYKTGDR